ncbi:sterol desaturase family protein [Pyruvatibacter sp.]|uniref:sterol desaturase family protein n=1 Tax=Pyruvatibacter sp. TaxID=1981328 RepID=UPI0032EACE34
MQSTDAKALKNRNLPARAPLARAFEKWLGMPLNLIEAILSYVIVRPLNWALRHLDWLSHRLEGTLLRRVLQHTIFPATMVISLYLSFEFVENGGGLNSLLVLALIPVIVGLFVAPLERLMPFSRNWLEGKNDMSVDLMMFFSGAFWNGFSRFLLQALFIVGIIEMVEPYGHDLWPAQLPGVVQVFLFILLKDFFRYWYHRALHEVPFLWRFHAAHHSVERLYWLNGIRSHPIEVIGQALLFAVPLALLQPSVEIAVVAVLMQLSIGIFQHANLDLKLGFWEYIFSIGDNHRYHHYPDKQVGDSNYGGEFIVWDILFGTFHKVNGERPQDKIGIGTAPNYPMTMAGLLIAPFLPDQKVFGAEHDGQAKAENQPDQEAASLQRAL